MTNPFFSGVWGSKLPWSGLHLPPCVDVVLVWYSLVFVVRGGVRWWWWVHPESLNSFTSLLKSHLSLSTFPHTLEICKHCPDTANTPYSLSSFCSVTLSPSDVLCIFLVYLLYWISPFLESKFHEERVVFFS